MLFYIERQDSTTDPANAVYVISTITNTRRCHITLRCVVIRCVTSRHVTSRRVASPHVTSSSYDMYHYVTSCCNVTHVTLRYITLFYVTLHCVTLRFVTLRIPYDSLRESQSLRQKYVARFYIESLNQITVGYI